MDFERQSGQLTVRWAEDYEGAGFGRLDVEVQSGRGFRARGEVWVNTSVIEEFIVASTSYPLDEEHSPRLRSGLLEPETGAWVYSASIQLQQVTASGQLALSVFLGDVGLDADTPADDRRESARVVMLTTYQRLAEFASDLRHVLANELDTATLDEERLA